MGKDKYLEWESKEKIDRLERTEMKGRKGKINRWIEKAKVKYSHKRGKKQGCNSIVVKLLDQFKPLNQGCKFILAAAKMWPDLSIQLSLIYLVSPCPVNEYNKGRERNYTDYEVEEWHAIILGSTSEKNGIWDTFLVPSCLFYSYLSIFHLQGNTEN